MQYSDQHPLDRLTLHIFLDESGAASGRLYEDDGISYDYEDGASCTTTYTASSDADGKIRLTASRVGSYSPASRSVEIKVYTPQGETKTATLNMDTGTWEIIL
jgi:alpha-glucosidase